MVEVVTTEIDRTLTATRVSGSRNAITAADLREWVVEYLAEYDKELARFPELAGRPHWNLWMMDTEWGDALFAAIVFGPAGLRLVCGTGDSFDIRGWGCDSLADSSGLEAELRQNFRVPAATVSIGRADAESWLKRGW